MAEFNKRKLSRQMGGIEAERCRKRFEYLTKEPALRQKSKSSKNKKQQEIQR